MVSGYMLLQLSITCQVIFELKGAANVSDLFLLGIFRILNFSSRFDNAGDYGTRRRTLTEEDSLVSLLIYYLAAFGAYTVSIILMTGQSFGWKETKFSFYIGGRKTGMVSSISTFCATWVSPLSIIGYGMWLYRDGYVAFFASVNGWLLGLLFFPFIVRRLRICRVLSLPEWLEKTYGDARARKLVALTMIFLYTLYLVIQFRAFGIIVSYMLEIPSGFAATSLVYLFVLYTTFGGYSSVVRSDVLNLSLIIFGVTAAAYYALPVGFTASTVADILLMKDVSDATSPTSPAEIFSLFATMLSWGLGVAGNPQYAIRIIACRRKRDAYGMLVISPIIIGWIYVCTTIFILVCRTKYVGIGGLEETLGFAKLGQFLPNFAGTFLLVGVIAAAVSTANSQLLLAASSLCYDLFPPKKRASDSDSSPMEEDRFLLLNRIAITAIASTALFLSHAKLPGYLLLGRISWTLVAICFFFPLFAPKYVVRKMLFYVLTVALCLQFVFVFVAGISPEYSMLVVLIVEAALFKFHRFFSAESEAYYLYRHEEEGHDAS